MKFSLLLISSMLIFFYSCMGSVSKDSVKKLLKENPDILAEAIQANPTVILDAFKDAAQKAQEEARKKSEEEEKKQLEERYDNPLVAQIRDDELFRGGGKSAPITLVEYSDFQCYYCSKGFNTVMELLEKYDDKIRFVFKHLPVIGQYSRTAAEYYEAIRLQDSKKAIKFHDALFEEQSKIREGGEKFLKEVAKKVGANMSKLSKDVKSEAVTTRIDEDMAEARKYGFQGTPGFLINGIPVKGAYPTSYFVEIVGELEKRGKLKL